MLKSCPLALLVVAALGNGAAIAQAPHSQDEGFLLAQAFKAPVNREIAARRRLPPPRASGDCSVGEIKLASLIPGEEFGMPLTASTNPVFYVYVPEVDADYVEFSIFKGRSSVYKAQFATPDQPGIVALSLPEDIALATGVTRTGKPIAYQWYFNVVCDQDDRSNDLKTNGWVHGVDDEDVSDLDATTLAEMGLWYDALKASFCEEQTATNNLLESVGLTDFMNMALIRELMPLETVTES